MPRASSTEMKTLLAFLAFIACAFAPGAIAAEPDLPPAYAPPAQKVAGRISIWGHGALAGRFDFIEALVKKWEDGFHRYHPDVVFENRLHGTASAIGALYTGKGDLALMGREIWPFEITAFQEVKGYEPLGIDVVTGSFKTRNRGYAIVVYVHKDNPIRGLSLKQLDAIFSVDRKRGGKPVRTWGDLGLTGEWADKPVHPYGFSIARGFADYLEQAVFLNGHRWNPEMREFADLPGSLGGATDGGQRALDAMANDRYGVAFSGALYGNPDVRPVGIGLEGHGPFVAASEATVMDHSYPLTRIITLFLDRPPGQPVQPHIREFVRYILSHDGQQAVLQEGGGYLPILAPAAARELRKLEN
jgi:phosphate transport system substrate-binding protein